MADGTDRTFDPQLCIAAGVAVVAAGFLVRPPWRQLVAGFGAALAGAGVASLVQSSGRRASEPPEHYSHYDDDKLHGALQDTFPASDPPAVSRGRTGRRPVH